MVRIYRYYVTGCGLFPFMQLHRDQAWPASENDAEKIAYACPTTAPEQTICLASYAHPNIALWKAQKWPVRRIDA